MASVTSFDITGLTLGAMDNENPVAPALAKKQSETFFKSVVQDGKKTDQPSYSINYSELINPDQTKSLSATGLSIFAFNGDGATNQPQPDIHP